MEMAEVEALRERVRVLEERLATIERPRELSAFHQALFEHSPTPMVFSDAEGRVLDVNPSFARWLDRSREDLRGEGFRGISHPDDLAVEEVLFGELANGVRPRIDLEKRYLRADGAYLWARATAVPVRAADGSILGYFASLTPLDASTEAEAAARAVDARNRALLDAVPDLLFVFDGEARFLDCKPARDAPLFMPPAAFIGRLLTDVLPPDLAIRQAAIIRQVSADGKPAIDLYSAPLPDGEHHFEASFFRCSTGEVVASVRDVTSRALAEAERDRFAAALAERVAELRRWKALADHAPDGIALVDRHGVLLYANAAFAALFACAESCVGMNVARLLSRPEEAREIARSLRENGHFRSELALVRKDGEGFVGEAVLFRVAAEDNTTEVYGAIVQDRTLARQAEEERLRLREQLIAAQEATIRELSTPLLPVAAGVLVMPLVGRVDAGRADRLLEGLLEGVVRHQANVAILDVTGVPVVDADVARALVRAASAVTLLGARTILTGMRPEVARELVRLGEDVTGLVPCSTLERGVSLALGLSRGR
jgi:PAS domain S-box-containing protein